MTPLLSRAISRRIGFLAFRCPKRPIDSEVLRAERTLRSNGGQREVEATLRDAERSLNEGDRAAATALLGPALQTLRWFP
jgi:hypothetical protein